MFLLLGTHNFAPPPLFGAARQQINRPTGNETKIQTDKQNDTLIDIPTEIKWTDRHQQYNTATRSLEGRVTLTFFLNVATCHGRSLLYI